MNLLLLLSALLSALTGVQSGAGAPRTAVVVSQVSPPASSVRVARVAVVGRPPFALPLVSARASFGTEWRLAALVPLFAGRRRE